MTSMLMLAEEAAHGGRMHIKQLQAKLTASEERVRVLSEAIEKVPHADDCAGWERLRLTGDPHLMFDHMDEENCDCWKRQALGDTNAIPPK